MSADRRPCVGCGFLVHDGALGTGAACPLCDWIDDPDQAADPLLAEGANALSLIEHQRVVLQQFPPSIDRQGAFARDPAWRPATPADGRQKPRAGEVCALTEDPPAPRSPYYWR